MKLYHTVVLLLALSVIVACKKQHAEPQKPDNGPLLPYSVVENFENQTSTYLCTYNAANQLQEYTKSDQSEKYSYTYNGTHIQSITYVWEGKIYLLELNYASTGNLTGGSYTTVSSNGEPSVWPLTCTQNGNETIIKTYEDAFTLTIKNGNLTSANFNTWYYKRKIDFTYGTDAGALYSNNLYLPNQEIANPLTPSSHMLRILVQMALHAFSKNNLLAAQSAMYNRTITYTKDDRGRVVNAAVQINKLSGEDVQPLGSKQIMFLHK